MPAVSLNQILKPALVNHYAIAGLVVLGYEDAVSFIRAAESLNTPIILQAGPNCRKHYSTKIIGPMIRSLAEAAKVPVVCHLDHGQNKDECLEGMDYGFTSIMYDGSSLPLAENIKNTREICDIAHQHNIDIEGEIGSVGYDQGMNSVPTNADEAGLFHQETLVDALAISIGNSHLMTKANAKINWDILRAIEAKTPCPLVIHGTSGITQQDRRTLARTSNICKFNIGTEIRQTFGQSLRQLLIDNPDLFDRTQILSATMAPLTQLTTDLIKNITIIQEKEVAA